MFVAQKGIEHINLLPYHRIAAGKYQKLHLQNNIGRTLSPSDEQMDMLKAQFEQHGMPAHIGA